MMFRLKYIYCSRYAQQTQLDSGDKAYELPHISVGEEEFRPNKKEKKKVRDDASCTHTTAQVD
jgi:hypothetical protein